jgi:hypothetical protein
MDKSLITSKKIHKNFKLTGDFPSVVVSICDVPSEKYQKQLFHYYFSGGIKSIQELVSRRTRSVGASTSQSSGLATVQTFHCISSSESALGSTDVLESRRNGMPYFLDKNKPFLNNLEFPI